jgi:ATP-dependent Clp protease ATP-binding subunit ClpA
MEIEHLLLKLVDAQRSDLRPVLKAFIVDRARLAQQPNRSLDQLKIRNSRTPVFSTTLIKTHQEAWTAGSLDFGAGVDLIANARAGKINSVLGRDAEIRQIIDILTKRRQNNPVRTEEARVGKTAVVERFGRRVADEVTRRTEVDSGARTVDNILTNTLLPEISRRLLSCMAQWEALGPIHVGVGENQSFAYS